MDDLHERLSEFSYGYGVIRETENLLRGVGIKAVPFLPSLVHEARLAFDVGFRRKGAPLLMQFKLGQSLTRFVRSNPADIVPDLDRPFWRFWLDTAEAEGQFETLLKAEQDNAEVYYVAPRFFDWSEYLEAFEAEEVLQRSLLIKPSEIRQQLVAQGTADGWHRIVYDNNNTYVCSEPAQLEKTNPRELAQHLKTRISDEPLTLAENIRRVFFGLSDRGIIRRETTPSSGRLGRETEADRQRRLATFRSRADSEDDAIAATLGIEVWSLGIQMIFATEE